MIKGVRQIYLKMMYVLIGIYRFYFTIMYELKIIIAIVQFYFFLVKLGNLPHIKKTPYIKGFFTTLLWLDQWNIPKKEEKIWASGGGRSEYQ